MDGTIIDTEHIWRAANRELITRRGIEFTPELQAELAQKLSGHSLKECCRIIKELVQLEEDLEDLCKEKTEIADRLYHDGIRFIEGFLAFHERALGMNLKIGLATNATNQTIDITNKKLDLEKLFGIHIYNSTHVNQQYKPHPAVYLHTAEQLGVKPEECIAIEDSLHGVTSAVNAGMFCIGINTSKKPDLISHSHLIIDEYHEIDLHILLEIKKIK